MAELKCSHDSRIGAGFICSETQPQSQVEKKSTAKPAERFIDFFADIAKSLKLDLKYLSHLA